MANTDIGRDENTMIAAIKHATIFVIFFRFILRIHSFLVFIIKPEGMNTKVISRPY